MLQPTLLPFAVYSLAVIFVAAAMIIVSYFLGQRHRNKIADEPYESGIAATGTARMRFDVKFYMIAMFFIIFDLESVFIFAWAVVLFETGWPGYLAMLIFIVMLLAMLLYLWRIGALDWGPRRKKNLISLES
jgi:NADH-quinone oxidoreductase subunit A